MNHSAEFERLGQTGGHVVWKNKSSRGAARQNSEATLKDSLKSTWEGMDTVH